jgi:hypothetical protein
MAGTASAAESIFSDYSCVHHWSLDDLGIRPEFDAFQADARDALTEGTYERTTETYSADVSRVYRPDGSLNLRKTNAPRLSSLALMGLRKDSEYFMMVEERSEPVTEHRESLTVLRRVATDGLSLQVARLRTLKFDAAGAQLNDADDELLLQLVTDDRNSSNLHPYSDTRIRTSMVYPGQKGEISGWSNTQKDVSKYPGWAQWLPPAIRKPEIDYSISVWHKLLQTSTPA